MKTRMPSSAEEVLPRSLRISLRRKLMVLVLATTFIGLLLMGITMMVFDLRTYRDAWVGDMFAQADLIGRASAPALAFDDEKVARENLSLLQDRPKVLAAAIYSASGNLFSSFTQAGVEPAAFPSRPEAEGYRVDGGELLLFKRIMNNNELVGTVYFRTRYELVERLQTYLAILAGVMAASLALAVFTTSWLQRGLTAPVLAMAGVARQVMAERDYSLRVERTTEDEVGSLVDAFNAMLSEIGRRSQALEASNRSLEQEMNVRRHAEEALLAADRQKDKFLATLAHELRNPLAPLLNALELLRRPGHDGSTTQATRAMMERQLRQLVQLVNDLLDVSRITTGKLVLQKKPELLGELVQAALEATAPFLAAHRHQLALSLPGEPVHLLADGTRIIQVFVNLLNNAAKFTNDGGRIAFSVRVEGDLAHIEVSDNGIGIAPAMLPHVFDMFAQADESLQRPHAGLGVGLSLARQLVELHGGSIEAASAGQGTGSSFRVRLPVLVQPSASAPGAGTQASAAQAPLRILIADDNVDYATSMAMLLELGGHVVTVTHDGQQALDEALRAPPDVGFLDIGLPLLHGYELARRLRESPLTRGTLLVAVSGWGQPEDKRLAREAGFDHHLAKPVEFPQMQALLDRFVQARREA